NFWRAESDTDARIGGETARHLALRWVVRLRYGFIAGEIALISALAFGLQILFPLLLSATIFGTVRGIIHDPTDRSIPGAQITIRSRTSNWSQTATSDAEGAFEFNAVPVGEYNITVMSAGFGTMEEQVTVISGSAPILHFALKVAGIVQNVEVSASPESISTQSS